jgi:signal transduction histidine kinase
VPESGLRNMRERALKHGGEFSISSTPGDGTTVTWTVPLSPSR